MKISCTLPCSYENLALRTQINFTVIHSPDVSPKKFTWEEFFFFTFCTLEIVIFILLLDELTGYCILDWTSFHYEFIIHCSILFYFLLLLLGRQMSVSFPSLFKWQGFLSLEMIKIFLKLSNTLRPYDDVVFLLVC